MADLINKKFIKVMWLPDEDRILLNITDETFIQMDSLLYKKLSAFIDFKRWKSLYNNKYLSWLNNDDASVYNIKDEVNLIMINALIEINKSLKKENIFYWFDVDRTNEQSFEWRYCPLSGSKLIRLENKFPKINSLISTKFPLIFPSTQSDLKTKPKPAQV